MTRLSLTSLLLLGAASLAGCALCDSYSHRSSIKDSAEVGTRVRSWKRAARSAPSRPPDSAAAPDVSVPEPRRVQSAAVTGKEDCRDQACDGLLRALVESRDRTWIIRPPTTQAHLSRLRMLAYRELRPQLTCGELAVGVEELRSVPGALTPPPAGASAAELTRALDLAAAVQVELRAEQDARCRPRAAPIEQPQATPPAARTPGSGPDVGQPAQAPAPAISKQLPAPSASGSPPQPAPVQPQAAPVSPERKPDGKE